MAHGAISSTEAVKGANLDMSYLGFYGSVFLPSVSDMGQLEPLAEIV